MIDLHSKQLERLFLDYYKVTPAAIEPLDLHASDRIYYRLSYDQIACIGTYSKSIEINKTFMSIAVQLQKAGIPSAKPLVIDQTGTYYLQEDLGLRNALEYLKEYPEKQDEIIKKSIRLAADMHHLTHWNNDRDMTSAIAIIHDDVHNFITCFIQKLYARIPEGLLQELERIQALFRALPLSQYAFTHRDFQLRNIIVNGDVLSVVDFQNALFAPGAYDIASLLFSSRLALPIVSINNYISYYEDYIRETYAKHDTSIRYAVFCSALCRVLQVLGAYGKISIQGNKKQFLKSIGKSQQNLQKILAVIKQEFGESFPVLSAISNDVFEFPVTLKEIPIELISFSYSCAQMPELHPRHINLVFDARMFTNPGRDEKLKPFTGRDKEIQDYVMQSPEYNLFINTISDTITSIYNSNYTYSAPITKMCVFIGCTGGRHRSVASVELIAQKLAHLGLVITKKHLNI